MTLRVWASAASVALAALALTLALSACGGEGEADAGASGKTKTASERREGALAFARCMRENGVDHPDPNEEGLFEITPESSLDARSESFRRAAETCRKHLSELPEPPALSAEERERMEELALAFARCMRKHGVDMPDPQFGKQGGGFAMELPDDFDPSDPDVREAEQACRKYAPKLPGAGGAG